ncbi:transposase [Streptomyces sp. NBC_00378]|uniref:transposase n=1 Tax=unclassified Streptomyces TaxID=2593676 RepID=UPI002258276A|nr:MULTISPECIES: transposase [unclassified Streptomyces]MCX5115416.1 transposase [Streptomyces sp. NBC_00378]
MPKPYPKEFREDVVRVARNREPGVTLEQIAADFGVHPITLSKWLRRANTDDGGRPATASGESAELREARKRIRLLEQENEVLRRAAAWLCRRHTTAVVDGLGRRSLGPDLDVDEKGFWHNFCGP